MYDIGDIVVVPYPFTDLTSSKQRPAIIIHIIHNYNDYLCMPITSRINDEKNRVNISNDDIEYGQLEKKSQVITDKLYTFNEEVIKKKFANIKKEKYLEMTGSLIKCLQNDIDYINFNIK